jgi:arylsulfatase A-like enzyme
MKYSFYFQIASILTVCSTITNATDKPSAQKPNVLFICIDDLRPELGCYGANYIKSPNIDKLANSGVLFTHQFVQVPTCGASRCSILTGMLPQTKGHLSNEACHTYISGKPETDQPETFIHHLRRNGYYTVGIGKISHSADGLLYGYNDPVGTERELSHSWNELVFDAGKWKTGWNAFFGYADGENRQSMKAQVKPYEKGNVDDDGYVDGLTANLAVKKLGELARRKEPFFLGIGFFKPHLPFNSPAKYWDLYNENTIELTPSPDLPINVSKASLHQSGEFNGYKAGDENASLEKPLSDAYARKIRHAYFAAVSYTDAQVGKVLDELERSGLAENTIVVIWGDHGWHLGDQRVWGKHTIFERALKSTLIVKLPRSVHAGERINKVVSSVDIYPTVMELCGVEMPFKTDGTSMVGLINNPSLPSWEEASYGYFTNGITVRTGRYRLTKYFRKEQPTIELYDHQTDPFENINIAGNHPDLIESLLPVWEKGNTGLFEK